MVEGEDADSVESVGIPVVVALDDEEFEDDVCRGCGPVPPVL